MIKWNAQFRIPDVTVQTATAFISVVSFENKVNKCTVKFMMQDEYKQNVIKEWTQDLPGLFNDEGEIYLAVKKDFPGSVIV